MNLIRKNLIAILVGVLFTLISQQNASAYYDPGVQKWINRDPIAECGFEVTRHGRPHPTGNGHAFSDTVAPDDELGFGRLGGWATFQSDSPNPCCFIRNSPVVHIDYYGLRMRTAFPKSCCDLDEADRIDKALKDLKKDWKYAQRYPEKGYMDNLRGDCNGARRALDLVSSCFGPFTPKQQAQFQQIRDAVEKYCGGDEPDPDQ